MARQPPRRGAEDDGWVALREARWEAARARFEEALARRETPELLEGLSWAAWWLDDAEAVFPARERAYRLYRAGGDAGGAARMATWLAVDHFDFHGARAVAQGWIGRARRLLEPLEPGPDHGWLAFQEGFLAHVAGDTQRACERAAAAADIGRRFGVPDLEMLGLALEGGALVAAAQVGEGMRRLDEATAAALEGEADVPISSAWSCCFLVSACAAVRDYERASEWCDRIRDFAERYGSRYMLAFCRSEYGEVLLWGGRWAEAEAELTMAVDDYALTRPAWAGGPAATLAELRRRQGRADEAADLLDEAGTSGAAQLARARMALDRGDALRAVEVAERFLRRTPEDGKLARAPALDVLVRAHVARGELEEADAALAELRDVALVVGTAALLAQADVAAGLLAAARGEHDRARSLLEDAVDRLEACGAPFETAQARIELATTLLALDRLDVAEEEAAAALRELRALGAGVEARRAERILAAARRADEAGPTADVTPRERDVLALLADGLTNRQIAERLVVSEHTVHRHVTNILRKLDLPSRTAAAAHAVRAGIVERDEH